MSTKAVIGITSTQMTNERIFKLWNGYVEAVAVGGGIPFILPSVTDYPYYEEYLDMVDGLLISGGQDMMPFYYGEEPLEGFKVENWMTPERDEFEVQLIKKAMERNMPILGICRGNQVLAAANGGTLYQDIDTCMTRTTRIKHTQECPDWAKSHIVNIKKESRLYQIIGRDHIEVNSLHHQAIKKVPVGFEITAAANDGVIEAMESTAHDFVLGVQWHPERLLDKDKDWTGFFRAFIEKSEAYHHSRKEV